MNNIAEKLDQLCADHPKFLQKGGLCVALVVTRIAKEKGLPLQHNTMRTAEGGQVARLGKGAVQKILADHHITKILAEEGGRTSRGSLGLMEEYVTMLNSIPPRSAIDFDQVEKWWITKVQNHFASEGPKLRFDPGMSLRSNLDDLFSQAEDLQAGSGGTSYVGAMLQHLVGAKFEIVLGKNSFHRHGFTVADSSTERQGDFQTADLVIHVTTAPSEALIRKCQQNLNSGFKCLIITRGDSIAGARSLLRIAGLDDRVDVIDSVQFLATNIVEHSALRASGYKKILIAIIERYNAIVEECETDPGLRINIGT